MKHLLIQARSEILELRRRNELLQAKVDVVNVFSAALLGPATQQGMSPDVAWALQKEIDKINAEPPVHSA